MMKRPARFVGETGFVAIELIGLVALVLLVSLGTLQIGMVGTAGVATQNAALVGARSAVMGRADVARTAVDSLPSLLRTGARASVRGGRVTVMVTVPQVLPGLSSESLRLSRSTTMPEEGRR